VEVDDIIGYHDLVTEEKAALPASAPIIGCDPFPLLL